MAPSYLVGLNSAQLQAVEHPPTTPLQILAGPGSGKTRVLTTRIAHLITHHGMKASSLCAVTFTNKAAGEMRQRLEKLIGKGQSNQIKMGTFHSLCAKFLRRHADKVGMNGNFTICDADESKKLLKQLLHKHKDIFEFHETSVPEPGSVASRISKFKAKGLTPRDVMKSLPKYGMSGKSRLERAIAEVYEEYQKTLRRSNSLDFDDLLVKGVQLFREHPSASSWCEYVLVDEFQDTNTTQYELMKHLAASHYRVTIVGDPDQSIYGWRSAEVENIRKMSTDFPGVSYVILEQNYRSSGAILAASVAIVAEDKNRMPKTLFTSHGTGPQPVEYGARAAQDEALFIAIEIKRLIAYTGGMLNYDDFAILLRYNSLSRVLERELQKEGIPNRILGGRKFFERVEIKDLLAYLQLADNPNYVPAFARVINVPARAIGPKTVEQILARATEMNISPMEVVQRIHASQMPDTKPPVKRKVREFLDTIGLLRERAERHCHPSILIPKLVQMIDYEEYLKKSYKDFEERVLNVQELMNFAAEMETLEGCRTFIEPAQDLSDDPMEDTPLRAFLQASMLSTDADASEDDNSPKVTVATCHAAKGLEWPAVFIPAVEHGVFPAARAEDQEEERRLLYVACTRAQTYLTLTHSETRYVNGESVDVSISPFLECLEKRRKALFTKQIPRVDAEERQLVANILGRKPPDENVVLRKTHEFQDERHRRRGLFHDPSVQAQVRDEHPSAEQAPGLAVYTGPVGFTTATAALQAGTSNSETKQSGVSKKPSSSATSGRKTVDASRMHPDTVGRSIKQKPPSHDTHGANAVIDLRGPSPDFPKQPKKNITAFFSSTSNAKVPSSGKPLPKAASVIVIDSSPEITPVALPPIASNSRTIKVQTSLPAERIAAPDAIPSSARVQAKVESLTVPGPISTSVAIPTASVDIALLHDNEVKPVTKKRLGMGRVAVGYSNKRFKPPS